jgi:hypothetical protein
VVAIHGNNSHGGVEGVRVSGKRGMSEGRAWASTREEARRRDARPSGGGVASRMADTPTPWVARWGNSPNRWWATEWPTWEQFLGHFWAELADGPWTKFEAREMLYILRLKTIVISDSDYEITKLQVSSVSVMTKIGKTQTWWTKRGPTNAIFLYALLQDISSIFCIWTNSSCLMKTWERGMPKSMALKSGLLKIGKCRNQPQIRIVSSFWACSTHFRDLTLKQSLFLIKFYITLSKGSQPWKVSRWHFLNGQTKVFQGPYMVNHHLEAQLGKMINMNIVLLCVLSVFKVL